MLVGVATRQYARSLEPLPAGVVSRGTSKSSVSRRFVAKTTAQLRAWQSAPLDGLDLVALLLDGVHIGEHCLVVALGIAADGQKHALGLWRAPPKTPPCSELAGASPEPRPAHGPQPACDPRWRAGPAQSGARGLRRGRPHSAVPSPQAPQHPRPPAGATAPVGPGDRAACLSGERREDGDAAPHESRQAPGGRLSQRRRQRPRRAGRNADRPHAAPLDPLQRSLATTNAAESLLSRTRHVKRNVKRWRGGQMMLRWVAARGPRSRQGLPAPEGMHRYAASGHRASRTGPATTARRLRGEGRVESHPSRRRVSTAGGTSPPKVATASPTPMQ